MGLKSSKSRCFLENSSEFDNLSESIPFDLLIDVLSYVPTKDLIQRCRLVCKQWRDIIDEQSVWKIKCEREKKTIPSIRSSELPAHFYRNIYIHNPYRRNLLKNNCGEDNLADWYICAKGGNGFVTENPPSGADPVPVEIGSTFCFATSYQSCIKYQFIDLYSIGVHPDLLNIKSTNIEVGEWYAARFDCSSVYYLFVILLDNEFDINKLDCYDGYINDYTCFASSVHENIVDKLEFEYREEQWAGRKWNLMHHTFQNVARVRYVWFIHIGKDSQFWAGHYGSKMTGAYVKLNV